MLKYQVLELRRDDSGEMSAGAEKYPTIANAVRQIVYNEQAITAVHGIQCASDKWVETARETCREWGCQMSKRGQAPRPTSSADFINQRSVTTTTTSQDAQYHRTSQQRKSEFGVNMPHKEADEGKPFLSAQAHDSAQLAVTAGCALLHRPQT
jgi:hypothetical protein